MVRHEPVANAAPEANNAEEENGKKQKAKTIDVLEEFEALLKKDDRKYANEEHECASCHLVDGDGGVEESHIHQLARLISANWRGDM